MKQRSLFSILNLSCREASELASAAADGELPRRDRIALRLHVFICAGCRRFVAQLQAIRRAMTGAPPAVQGDWNAQPAQLSPERREAIKQLLAQASQPEE